MECNKDEAARAKSIAESKFEQKDYFGAKKFALKAQTLYPGLCGISHMLTTLDVYLAAENKFSGEVDWYGVLDLNPSADDSTIKKQYRKLALLLHPDKNNSVGADGAFKLISEAWKFLADKEKRMAYNRRRGKGFHQKVPEQPSRPSAPCRPPEHSVPAYTGGQSVPPRPSRQKVPSAAPPKCRQKKPPSPLRPSQEKVPRQQNKSTKAAPPECRQTKSPSPLRPSQQKVPRQQNKSTKVSRTPNPSPFFIRSDTFWTFCHGCNVYFEYLKIYCNHTILCHNCQKPFLALATAPPTISSESAKPVPWLEGRSSLKNLASHDADDQKRNAAAAQTAGDPSHNSFTDVSYKEVPFPGTANTDEGCPSTANSEVQQQAQDNLKRSHTESAGLEGCFKKVKVRQ